MGWCTRTAAMAALLCGMATCHSVLRWPAPRNRNPSNRRLVGADSACGISPPAIDEKSAPTVAPGVATVWISEAIRLAGSPWRLELTTSTSDRESCVLLDHIPHDIDAASPVYGDESTWNDYFVSVHIPDVDCGKAGCSLLLVHPRAQADSCRNGNGAPPPPECDAVYYSCSKPLRFSGGTKRGKFPTNGESCWKGKEADRAVIKAADGTAISWMSPDDEKTAVTFKPNIYRRESAVWSRGLLTAGFEGKQVDAQVRALSGPAAASYSARFPASSDSGSAPAEGLRVLGVLLLVLLVLGLAAVLALTIIKARSAEASGLWASLATPTLALVVAILAIRALELLLCITNIIVVAVSVSALTTGPAYVIAATVLLLVYSLVPFSVAGFLVQLNADKEGEGEADDGFFKKLDNFQRRSPGSLVLLGVDALLCLLLIFAAGTSCFLGVGMAAVTFTLMVLEMAMVVLGAAAVMAEQAGDADEEEAAADKTGAVSAPDGQEPPLAAGTPQTVKKEDQNPVLAPVIRVAEFDYAKQRPDELSFSEGDRIEVLNERTDGWAKGILIDSTEDPKPQGMFPLNYTGVAES